MMARWHKTHETHDGTRPAEFSQLTETLCVMAYVNSKKREPVILDNNGGQQRMRKSRS